MLRITIHNHSIPTRFILEGRLTGEWVKELERCWRQATATHLPQHIRIELTDVLFIDETGRELLKTMAEAGTELATADLVMKAILEEVIEGGTNAEID